MLTYDKSPSMRALSTFCLFLFALAQIKKIHGSAVNSVISSSRSDFNYNNHQPLQVELRGRHSSIMTADGKKNLTAVTWAHAVNSQRELKEALDSDVEMIEADVLLGQVNDSGPIMPIMAHSVGDTSDLSLADFLNQIMAYNHAHVEEMKGVKLDFKSIETFEGSLDMLGEMVPLISYPIWLNADIINGPVNHTGPAVDADRFLTGCARFDKAVISIGWMTHWGPNFREGAYEGEAIDNMLDAIKNNNITGSGQPITFPVRAGIAANSREQLHELVRAINDTNDSSITIWSPKEDYVNIEKLRELIFSFGFHRVYLDVPEELASKLNLGRGAGSRTAAIPTLLNFAVVTACIYIASKWLQSALL